MPSFLADTLFVGVAALPFAGFYSAITENPGSKFRVRDLSSLLPRAAKNAITFNMPRSVKSQLLVFPALSFSIAKFCSDIVFAATQEKGYLPAILVGNIGALACIPALTKSPRTDITAERIFFSSGFYSALTVSSFFAFKRVIESTRSPYRTEQKLSLAVVLCGAAELTNYAIMKPKQPIPHLGPGVSISFHVLSFLRNLVTLAIYDNFIDEDYLE